MAIKPLITDNIRVAQQIIIPDQEFTSSPAWISVEPNKYDISTAGFSKFTIQFNIKVLEGDSPELTLRMLELPASIALNSTTIIEPEVTPAKVYETVVYNAGETEPYIGSNVWPVARIVALFDPTNTTRVVIRTLLYLWGVK